MENRLSDERARREIADILGEMRNSALCYRLVGGTGEKALDFATGRAVGKIGTVFKFSDLPWHECMPAWNEIWFLSRRHQEIENDLDHRLRAGRAIA